MPKPPRGHSAPRRKSSTRKKAVSPCGGLSASECEKLLEHVYELMNSCDIKKSLAAEIQRHLDTCRSCFTRFEFEKKLMARLKEACGCCSCPETLTLRVKALIKSF